MIKLVSTSLGLAPTVFLRLLKSNFVLDRGDNTVEAFIYFFGTLVGVMQHGTISEIGVASEDLFWWINYGLRIICSL